MRSFPYDCWVAVSMSDTHTLQLVQSSCSVSLSLCDLMDCSTPGFPVHHQLLELAQTLIHWVNDAIQPSHPLSFSSPPAFNLLQDRVFSNESVLWIRWPKYWSFSFSFIPFSEYSGLISFRMDWFHLLVCYVVFFISLILEFSLYRSHIWCINVCVDRTYLPKQETF